MHIYGDRKQTSSERSRFGLRNSEKSLLAAQHLRWEFRARRSSPFCACQGAWRSGTERRGARGRSPRLSRADRSISEGGGSRGRAAREVDQTLHAELRCNASQSGAARGLESAHQTACPQLRDLIDFPQRRRLIQRSSPNQPAET
jgi:hypothetical protein